MVVDELHRRHRRRTRCRRPQDRAPVHRDLDPAGEGIEAQIEELAGFDEIHRVALTLDQALELDLPENVGVDGRLAKTPGRIPFLQTYGRLFQIEVDAIPPEALQTMVLDAAMSYMDLSTHDDVVAIETVERAELTP